MKNLFSILVISLLVATHANAAEMDHSQMHDDQQHQPMMSSDESASDDKHHGMDHDMTQSMDHKGMDHNMSPSMDHQGMNHKDSGQQTGHSMSSKATTTTSSVSLKPLTKVPPSGKAREAGFDGTYTMEDTSVDHSLARRCALASRGLVMLDNAGWKQCSNIPEGLPKTVSNTPADNDHQGMHH